MHRKRRANPLSPFKELRKNWERVERNYTFECDKLCRLLVTIWRARGVAVHVRDDSTMKQWNNETRLYTRQHLSRVLRSVSMCAINIHRCSNVIFAQESWRRFPDVRAVSKCNWHLPCEFQVLHSCNFIAATRILTVHRFSRCSIRKSILQSILEDSTV